MSESNTGKSNYSYDEKRIFNIDLPVLPEINPGSRKEAKSKFRQKELEAMIKEPGESPELIRYLIEIIKSL